jgi:hypothetical protein
VSRPIRVQNVTVTAHEIRKDLHRTYPREKWFRPHKKRILNILLWLSSSDEKFSYAQPFSFLAFTIYYVFHNTNESDSMVLTYHALRRIITVVSPTCPTDAGDTKPLIFHESLKSLVRMKLLHIDAGLNDSISGTMLDLIILNGVPTLFTNWFDIHGSVHVLDYIIDEDCVTMFSNMVHFLISLFLTQEVVFTSGFNNEDICCLIMSKTIFDPYTVVSRAKSL